MKKSLLLFCSLSIFCLSLIGCSNINTEENKEFNINSEQLESDGYEKIADIAYGKIEKEEDKTTIYLTYINDNPKLAIYLMSSIMEETNYESDFVIKWNGKEYPFNDEIANKYTEDNYLDAFPSDWRESFLEAQNNGGFDSIVTKKDADYIDENVEKFVAKNNVDIIIHKEYSTGKGKIDISIGEKDGKQELNIECEEVTEEKAFLLLAAFMVEFENISDEFSLCSCNIKYNGLFALVQYPSSGSTKIISGLNKDGSFTMDMPDWIDKDIDNLSMSKEDMQEYLLDVESNINDFGKEAGYKMGYLLH